MLQGAPVRGWEAGPGEVAKVALVVGGPEKLTDGEMRLTALNLQGFGKDTRVGLARWAQLVEGDWIVGSEHQQARWDRTHFAGFAVKASCLPGGGEGMAGGKREGEQRGAAKEAPPAARRGELGSFPCSNSTSTTGPMTCVIFPVFSPIY